MAAVAPSADQATGLLQNLSLDSSAKTVEIQDATKKPSANSGNVGNVFQTDRSVTPILPDFVDPAHYVHPSGYQYYYGGYDGNAIDWDDYVKYLTPDGAEMTPGVYGENGSIMYPAYGYPPYSPYSPAGSPVPTMGHNGQQYGAQHYQYPSPYFQSPTHNSGSFPTAAASAKGDGANDRAPLAGADKNSKSNGIVNNSGTKGTNGAAAPKATHHNSSFNANGSYGNGCYPGGFPASGYQDPRFAFDGLHSPIPWVESPYFSDGHQRPATRSDVTSTPANRNCVNSSRNQNYHPQLLGLHQTKPLSLVNTASGYYNTMYPNKLYGNGYRSSMGYGGTGSDSRGNGRSWMSVDSKYKPRGRGNSFYCYGNVNIDGLNELNRGPRVKSSKNSKGLTPVALAVKGLQNISSTPSADNEEKSIATPDHELYNRLDFPETYADARFYVIKSYSEDDVHKSIKYNVWASTPNGNKKLDAAYSEAKHSESCPIFLFFSVNTSGQFVGVAEMVGHVDFDKSVEYWQQDKWVGCFPVKWHIVKDVPNSLLKHIILENNENKPVTNSRDTQEVKMDQGLQMLKFFKDHTYKQCILDDFDFYEERQKRIQEKKAKNLQYQKQVRDWKDKSVEKLSREIPNGGDVKSQKSTAEVSPVLEEANQINGDGKTFETIPETKIAANGVAEGF